MFYDPRENLRPAPLSHNPFNALVAPRPIAWVSSIDSAERVNLAPFSYFNAVSADPPYVMIAIGSKDREGTPKDTLRNLREVPEFVVNIASAELRQAVNQTSKVYAHDVNEFEETGLMQLESRLVRPPRVAESKAALECRVHRIIRLPGPASASTRHMVIGEVIGIHISDDVIDDGKVVAGRLHQLSRLGYFEYDAVEETFTMPRPDGETGNAGS